jgi:hypothetical protein
MTDSFDPGLGEVTNFDSVEPISVDAGSGDSPPPAGAPELFDSGVSAINPGIEADLNPQPLPPGGDVELNPQPLPPGGDVELNPQPLPPGGPVELNPQPLPPGGPVELNPQPLPPGPDPAVVSAFGAAAAAGDLQGELRAVRAEEAYDAAFLSLAEAAGVDAAVNSPLAGAVGTDNFKGAPPPGEGQVVLDGSPAASGGPTGIDLTISDPVGGESRGAPQAGAQEGVEAGANAAGAGVGGLLGALAGGVADRPPGGATDFSGAIGAAAGAVSGGGSPSDGISSVLNDASGAVSSAASDVNDAVTSFGDAISDLF